MILLLIVSILFIFLFLKSYSGDFHWKITVGDIFAALFFGTGFALITVIIIVLVASSTLETEPRLVEEYKIYALSNSVGSEGTFFLGSGNINNKMSYFVIKEYKNGQKIESLKVENSWLEINNEIEPKVEKYYFIFSNDFARKILGVTIKNFEYRIIIPEGSVKYNFNVELP